MIQDNRDTRSSRIALITATASALMLGGLTARAADVPTTRPAVPAASTASNSDDADLREEVRELKAKLDAVEAREAARDRADAVRAQAAAATAMPPAATPSLAPTQSTAAPVATRTSSFSLTPAGDAGATSGDDAPATYSTPVFGPMASLSGSTASAVEQDAALHSNALDLVGPNAGYVPNKGFIIKSDNQDFLMHPWAFIQGRYVANYRQDGVGGGNSTDSGFEIARLKFILDGNLFGPDLTYQFIWNTVKSGGELQLNDGWVRYRFMKNPDLAIQGGQIRDPLDHEQILFATQSLTADRSLVDDLLAGGEGIVQGVDLTWGYDVDGPFRSKMAFTHGLRNNDVGFQDFPTNVASWGLAGRFDFKLSGDWQNYDRFTALNVKKDLLVVGAGLDYTEAGNTDDLVHVLDAQYTLPNGFSIYGGYLGRYTVHNSGLPGTLGGSNAAGVAGPYTYDATGRVMVSYLMHEHFEPFVRYEYLQFDPKELTPGTRFSTVHDIGIGANYYFYGQRAKLTGNVLYLPNGVPVSDLGVNDFIGSAAGGNEIVFQLQFQVIL